MDHQSASNTGAEAVEQQALGPDSPLQLRDRRREKPLLSCTFCRSRKVRCDRQLPCKTCTSRGIGSSCTYRSIAPRKSKVSVGDRIQQLESLVRSLAQQQQTSQTSAGRLNGLVPSSSADTSPQGLSASTPASVDEDTIVPALRHASLPHSRDHAVSPAPSESGSMRLDSHGAKYVGSVHWAAVLDSISELRDHYEEEEEARILAINDYVPRQSPGPRLLYEPVQFTKADILASIPPRRAVDRMVGRYLSAQWLAPAVLHSGRFLREYERFWQEPAATPFLWIALLFSIMCISTQFQESIEDSVDPETPERAHVFREQTIHCLILGQYTKGGEYVLETMVNYLAGEMLLPNGAEIGHWLVEGMLVQLALTQGYHRDPKNFPNISPFAGEMRRRVWAVIMQIDLRLSSQMALPRLLKLQQYDTAEPRNLLDTDLDEDTVELPPSRPETEVTPVLFSLARGRLDKMAELVSDLVNDTQGHPYTEIMELDRKLQEAKGSLPPIFRWQPLSHSLTVSPQIVIHRILLQLTIQRQTIWLHRKYLAPSYIQKHYEYSRNACVQAAIKILEFQQIVEEEVHRDGLLYPVRWMFKASRLQAVFLLGISILCYYVQLAKARPNVSLDQDTGARIHSLLNNTYSLWVRLSTVSREARRAVEHLDVLLGRRQDANALDVNPTSTSSASTMPQEAPVPFDQFTWDAYRDCMADFPEMGTFGAEFACLDAPRSSSSMADQLLANATELDTSGWMDWAKAGCSNDRPIGSE